MIPSSQTVRRKSFIRSVSCHTKQKKPDALERSQTLDGYKFVTFNLNHTYHPVQNSDRSSTAIRIVPNLINFFNGLTLKDVKLHKPYAQRRLVNENRIERLEINSNSSERSNLVPQSSRDIEIINSTKTDTEKKKFPKSGMQNFQFDSLKGINRCFLEKPTNVLINYQRIGGSETNSISSSNSTDSLRITRTSLRKKGYCKLNEPFDFVSETFLSKERLNSFEICSLEKSSNASSSSNNASLGGSDYTGYQNYRSAPRNARERDQDLRDPIEPLDSHHSYHHPNPNHHYDHHHHHREGSVKRRQFTRSLSNTDPPPDEKTGKYPRRIYIHINFVLQGYI